MSQPEPISEVDLLRRMAGGDTAALAEFYDRHAATLLGLATRILHDAKEAEDVIQEVFLIIWDKAGAFDESQGRPLSWTLTLTRNRAIDRLRASQRRRTRLLEESTTESVQDYAAPTALAPEHANAGDQGALLRSALARLPEPQRRAIELAFFDGLSQTEVATALNEPLGTVKARIRRGMLKLRSELEQCL